MGLTFNSNSTFSFIGSNLAEHTKNLNANLRRLSSGTRIGPGEDDIAGFTSAARMRVRSRSLSETLRTIEKTQGLAGATMSVAQQTMDMLGHMKEAAQTAQNTSISDDERNALSAKFVAAYEEIKRLSSSEYNGLDIATGATYRINVGEGNPNGDISWTSPTLTSGYISVFEPYDLSNPVVSGLLIPFIDSALDVMGDAMDSVGTAMTRMDYSYSSILAERESLERGISSIADIDIARETAELTKNKILQQGAMAVMAQAHLQSDNVLMLISAAG